jgi:hypothetical protein
MPATMRPWLSALQSGAPNQVFQIFAVRVNPRAFRLPSRDQFMARIAFTTEELEMRGRER